MRLAEPYPLACCIFKVKATQIQIKVPYIQARINSSPKSAAWQFCLCYHKP